MIMGMGAGACSGWVISYDDLKSICPKEVDLIERDREFDTDIRVYDFQFFGGNWGEVSRGFEMDELPDSIKKSVDDLIGQFLNATGLTLSLGFYNEDDGDRYDEVASHEGCVFFVDGMVALTPAGEKFKDVVKQQLWTQYG
jgi:hypothetical protein